ncbi:MAG: hypothetical protein KatS3mg053_0881 [Candidatus Roseilinea sp.]|nr:MAG: hypothetical protein KatS3mg053_0881 [Candidatus Roseilinea sp.]
MLPLYHAGLRLATVEVNENRITPQWRRVGGIEYVSVVLDSNRHRLVANYELA